MALWAPKQPGQLVDPSLPSTLGLTTKVTVSPDFDNNKVFKVRWIPVLGAVRYIVYVSPSPMNKNVFKEVGPTYTQLSLEIPMIVPDEVMFYFWVGYINAYGAVVMIQEEPVYMSIDSAFESSAMSTEIKRDIFTDDDMKFYAEEIRRRNLAMLQNNGENFVLYVRRMLGATCISLDPATGQRATPMSTPFVDKLGTEFDGTVEGDFENNEARDPEYQGHFRCANCLGTGIVGGYYPGISVRVRYGNLPRRTIKLEETGIEVSHDFDSWTIWHPRLKERDVLVRVRTNERFVITKVGQSEWRGMPLHQQFNTISDTEQSMIYEITDDKIRAGLEAEGAYDIARWDWSIWA